jgi:dihydroxy-acid dehydratase
MKSDEMKLGMQRAAARSLLKSTGLSQSDIERPWIGVVNFFTEVVPGHVHLQSIARAAKEGVFLGGGQPFEFNTIAVCDGIAQGTDGMKYSLPSRDLAVETIEIMVQAHKFDGMVLIPACDKTVPAALMACARLDIPSIIVTGGPMLPGIYGGRELSLVEMREFIGKAHDGTISEEELHRIESIACPSAGSCSMMATANTMGAITEALGMSMPGCATTHAVVAEKRRIARRSGEVVMRLLEDEISPRDIMTAQSLRNAVRVDMALGGSLNSVLHSMAIAKELEIDDFDLRSLDEAAKETPQLCSLKPAGDDSVLKLDQAGGIPAVMNELARAKLIDTNAITVTGKTVGENLESFHYPKAGDEIIRSFENPVRKEGSIAVLFGSLAPNGAVIKQAALPKDMMEYEGPAQVFGCLEDALDSLWDGEVESGTVMVVRYEGPKGGPGMREQHSIASLISGLEEEIVLVTDGRFSGSSRGAAIGHVAPEAADGGPIGIVEDGDMISYSVPERRLTLELDDDEIEERLEEFSPQPQEIRSRRSVLNRYRELVSSADRGAIYGGER